MTKARNTTMLSTHRALILGAALVAASGAEGCGTDTCAAGDDACILAHLRIYDQGGNPVTLTPVPASAIKPGTRTGTGSSSSSGGSGGGSTSSSASSSSGSSDVPTVTGWPSSTTFSDSSYLEVTLAFTDPCGERPGGCFGVHHPGKFPGSWMTTGPVYDAATTGNWPLQVGFDYTTTADDTFELDFVAWSSCGGPDADAIAALVNGSSVAIGAQVDVTVTVDVPVASSGSGGGCISPTVTDTLRSGCCTTTCPAACADSNGNAWYEVGTTVYGPCPAGTNACLQSAASSAVAACGPGG